MHSSAVGQLAGPKDALLLPGLAIVPRAAILSLDRVSNSIWILVPVLRTYFTFSLSLLVCLTQK